MAYVVQYQYFHRRCTFRTHPVNLRLIKIAISVDRHVFSPLHFGLYMMWLFLDLGILQSAMDSTFSLSFSLVLSAREFFIVRVSQYIRDEEGSEGTSIEGRQRGGRRVQNVRKGNGRAKGIESGS